MCWHDVRHWGCKGTQLPWRKEAYVNFHEELGFEFGFASNVGQMKEEDHIPNLGNGVSLDTEAEITLAYS